MPKVLVDRLRHYFSIYKALTPEEAVEVKIAEAYHRDHALKVVEAATSVAVAEGQVPAAAVQAVNDFGSVGWTGPADAGDGTHRYVVGLHALSAPSGLVDGLAPADAVAAIESVTVAIAELAFTYG